MTYLYLAPCLPVFPTFRNYAKLPLWLVLSSSCVAFADNGKTATSSMARFVYIYCDLFRGQIIRSEMKKNLRGLKPQMPRSGEATVLLCPTAKWGSNYKAPTEEVTRTQHPLLQLIVKINNEKCPLKDAKCVKQPCHWPALISTHIGFAVVTADPRHHQMTTLGVTRSRS